MGRKINPIGFRLAVRRDWRSRWYAKGRDFAALVINDAEVRRHIENKYPQANISLVEIERKAMGNVRVVVHTGRPGALIGKKGEGIELLRVRLARLTGVKDVGVDIKEVAQPDANAKLIALNIASQLERRIMFRRAMRRAMAGAMRLGVEGVKIMCAGRLNGIEIARTEWYREGRLPLHTLKNDVDYGFATAKTNMGVVGIKVWVSRGDGGARKKPQYFPSEPARKTEYKPAAVSGDAEIPETKSMPSMEQAQAAQAMESPSPEANESGAAKQGAVKQGAVKQDETKQDAAKQADGPDTADNPDGTGDNLTAAQSGAGKGEDDASAG